ncbi:MAG: zinc ribbon domain-containing protein [Xanthobacteraceae bacterium]
MPVYDYLCARCGSFTEMRPMAECDVSHKCPQCGRKAPRAFLTAPYFASMSADRRLAHATNERSASAPRAYASSGKHGPGCRCCRHAMPAQHVSGRTNRTNAKSFPARGPWMISH